MIVVVHEKNLDATVSYCQNQNEVSEPSASKVALGNLPDQSRSLLGKTAVPMNRSAHIKQETFSNLHQTAISDKGTILRLLHKVRESGSIVSRGLNHRLDIETATVQRIEGSEMILRTKGFRRLNRGQVFLNFDSGEQRYFFAVEQLGSFNGINVTVEVPSVIFRAERRDRLRTIAEESRTVEILLNGRPITLGRLADSSPGGLGIRVPTGAVRSAAGALQVRYRNSDGSDTCHYAQIRNITHGARWDRLGLVSSTAADRAETSEEIWSTLSDPRHAVQSISAPHPQTPIESETVRFADDRNRELVGFVDSWGDGPERTVVVLQTGWGDTKENLLPLALTIAATFRAHSQPVSVIRYDGVMQRGESYNAPECRLEGREFNRFGFSQPVRDLRAAVSFMSSRFSPTKTILVSQSISAISGRKFVSRDRESRIDGWVCVVGTPDLQSASRSISGGIDYAAGYERDEQFGYQELLGVQIHADRMMRDAVQHELLFLDDARRDFSRIKAPVTWFHGKFDAWVDVRRVRDAFGYGPQEARRLIQVPIAHRLGWGDASGEAFKMIASEVSRLALGTRLEACRETGDALSARRRKERNRLPRKITDLRRFWKDYLVGRDESYGIELMTACEAYADLMSDQISFLSIEPFEKILDAGCGTGSLAPAIARTEKAADSASIIGLDYVRSALIRARSTANRIGSPRNRYLWLTANLDVVENRLRVPIASESVDRVLASLVLSYVERPSFLLEEFYRVLRPNGRLVMSSLTKDADISRLYTESLAELQIVEHDHLDLGAGNDLPGVARSFLSDASEIIELEKNGTFEFWEEHNLVSLLERAGFTGIRTTQSFGTPAQAIVALGVRGESGPIRQTKSTQGSD